MATFGQKLRLFRGLLSREVAHTDPIHAVIDLTRRRNLHCLGSAPVLQVGRPSCVSPERGKRRQAWEG